MTNTRREFITLLGGATAWPLAARAQQTAMPVVGYLGSTTPEMSTKRLAAFRKGLRDAGFEEGQNVAIEFRWADGHEERMPELVADLVRRGVAVIVAPASTAGALAAKAATTTIPIVFATGSDPVALGLVPSLSRPGGNVTGVTILGVELTAKRLSLLRELTPQATRFVALVNPRSVMADGIVKNVEASAPIFGLPVEIVHASTDRELVAALSGLSQRAGAVLLVTVDGFFFNRRALIVTLELRMRCPPSTTRANMPRSAGLSATVVTSTMSLSSAAFIPAAFSKARNRPTCRWQSRPSSSWSSTW